MSPQSIPTDMKFITDSKRKDAGSELRLFSNWILSNFRKGPSNSTVLSVSWKLAPLNKKQNAFIRIEGSLPHSQQLFDQVNLVHTLLTFSWQIHFNYIPLFMPRFMK
jgi:hypothetical protein